ncbi:MAG: hypothetical protein P4N59_12335 [Negativicutes bacterium]|nr:hypothetical protein [Negativicutes bacterium]
MEDNEKIYAVLKDMYARSWNDANDIIARAQNPLTALSVIIAILMYIAPKVYDFPKMSLENAPVLGGFYLLLDATLICSGLTCYYLLWAFRPGGYNYKTIRSPEKIIALFSSENDGESLLPELIRDYKIATENNLKNNRLRHECIRKATETIILAVAFCFPCGLIFCIIVSIIGLNR